MTLVTGFLGSGKTTLISRLLGHPDMGRRPSSSTSWATSASTTTCCGAWTSGRCSSFGCVCCTLRGDLADELRDLLSRRERGEIPEFRRVVIETTGLADPAPIVYTLLSEPVVRHHYALETVVATVDAVHGFAATSR